jgi:trans-AT polyketide synthase, acyltransferase and oxidoreductase domains
MESSVFEVKPHDLGSALFRKEYGIKYAYVAGGMYRGIASKEMIVALGKAGLMGFFGSAALSNNEIEESIEFIQTHLSNDEPYGVNFIHVPADPQAEMDTISLFLKYGVTRIEATAFMSVTPALVYFRLKGLSKDARGKIVIKNRILAKISRPEIGELFMSPPPMSIVKKLFDEGKITEEEAALSQSIPLSFDICVEADSGGHTDQGIPTVLLPGMQSLRKEITKKYSYKQPIRMGLAGGIGTPEAAASAFIMNADFILTGSINQCTVEAGMSDIVKDMLQSINIQDTDYAPAGDMFEFGAKVQVLKKGVFFPARANKLYALYNQYSSLDEIPEQIKIQLEKKYFKKTFSEIWQESKEYFLARGGNEVILKAESNPKQKMALVFRWYFGYSTRLSLQGKQDSIVDFQVHTGPSLGAFNQWVKGTSVENWRNRHVAQIGEKLMQGTAKLISQKMNELHKISAKESVAV